MTLKNILSGLIIKSLLCTLIFKNIIALAVMVILGLAWFGLDVYQNTIEEWR